MPPLIRALSRRDAVLILIGAVSMHFFASMAPLNTQAIARTVGFGNRFNVEHVDVELQLQNDQEAASGSLGTLSLQWNSGSERQSGAFGTPGLSGLSSLPETTIVEHVPGWTLFRDIYMANGTLLILTSSPSSFPETRYMTSTGLAAENTPQSKALREPTPQNMDTISPEEAVQRWGGLPSTRRVWTVEGNTLLFNDPPQFLDHYYHFCAELLFGTWSFWTAAVHPNPPPTIHRAIFPHSSNTGWRDKHGFNGYFLRAAFPSLTVEVDVDWEDRVNATSASIDSDDHRAWHFPYLLLTDRSAAFRGELCGGKNQRTASESVDTMIARSKLDNYGSWWRSVRNAVWHFAGVTAEDPVQQYALEDGSLIAAASKYEEHEKILITYISRQSSRRHLISADHDVLVKSLEDFVKRKNAERVDGSKEWQLDIVLAEKLTKDEQIRLAARTTILLGVHGNGLSHLILMPHTSVSAVIEIFYPGGFAHDYEWTTRALGMTYFGVWNDTYFSEDTPKVAYPNGFQGTSIPVYGPTVADLIEKHVVEKKL